MSNLSQEFGTQELENLSTPPAIDVSTLTVKQNNGLARHHPLVATTLTDGNCERHPNASHVLRDRNHHVKPPNTLAQNDGNLNNHSRTPLGNVDVNVADVRGGDQAIKEKSVRIFVEETQMVKDKRAMRSEESSSAKRQRMESTTSEPKKEDLQEFYEVMMPIVINGKESVPWNPFEFPPKSTPDVDSLNSILFRSNEVELSHTDRDMIKEIKDSVEKCIQNDILSRKDMKELFEKDGNLVDYQVKVQDKIDDKPFKPPIVKVWFRSKDYGLSDCARAFMAYVKRIYITPKGSSTKEHQYMLFQSGHGQCHSNDYLTVSLKPVGFKGEKVPIEEYKKAIEKWLSKNPNFTFKGAWHLGRKNKDKLLIEYEDEVWFTIWRNGEIDGSGLPDDIRSGDIGWSSHHPEGTGFFEVTCRGKGK